MARLKLEVGAATDVGRRRERNEDCYAVHVAPPEEDSQVAGLLLVADGMGGERGGGAASRLAAERLVEDLRSGPGEAGDLAEALRLAIRKTSDEIRELGRSDPSVEGLGTTLVTAVVTEDQLLVAHVGDSRCYRIRHGTIQRLTADHTWVEDQVGAGRLTAEEARLHPQRNVLTRTLGDTVSPGVDVRAESLADDDLFLLCSDGLTNGLSDSEILRVAQRFRRPQDLADALVALANDRDGSDNITAVVCRCRDTERRPEAAEPEDTEPMERPRGTGLWLLRKRPLVAAGVLVLILLSHLVPRFFAARAFERGVAYVEDEQYLHARQEFSKAIRLGLDEERAEQLIDILLTLPSPEAGEDIPEQDGL